MNLFENNSLIDHVEIAEEFSSQFQGKNLAQKNSGKFYTPEAIAMPLLKQALAASKLHLKKEKIRIIDPFCGDGRLLRWILPLIQNLNSVLEVHLWDYDEDAVAGAEAQIKVLGAKLNINFSLHPKKVDAFSEFFNDWESSFDLIVTNPPWEVVKPSPKDISQIANKEMRERYISSLKSFSDRLLRDFPLSKPAKSYGGWGVNLARVGTELSVRLAKKGGVTAIVTPSTIFADQNSHNIRKWLFTENNLIDLNVYPAELKLFANVDQPSVSFILKRDRNQKKLNVTNYQSNANPVRHSIERVEDLLITTNYIFPLSVAASSDQLEILLSFSNFSPLSDLEDYEGLWLGRELDETNYKSWISLKGKYRFIKGRDIDRYGQPTNAVVFINEDILKKKIPASIEKYRIVWRDVSRPTQKRRVIATLLTPGCVTGNSLGVLHIKEPGDTKSLNALLGLISSFIFEFQLRAYLATAHISAGAMRRIRIPAWNTDFINRVSELVEKRLNNDFSAENEIEVRIARAYGLDKTRFGVILRSFPRVTDQEKEVLLNSNLWNT
ncbi:MAG: Alw26I/Eco31I/Esp3I family type II restriction adenine-specific DNA-methyltransferase [Patescibacteria group bacterium]